MRHVCPVCGGPVRITHVEITMVDDVRTTVYEGTCERCGSTYKLTRREYMYRHPWELRAKPLMVK